MTYLESIILGIVQGLGEFLPISSSAHLVVLPWFLKFKDPGLTFNVMLHFGTLLAVILYFWKDWIEILSGTFRKIFRLTTDSTQQKDNQSHFIFWLLIIATIPGALAGFLLEDLAETAFRHPLLVAFSMALLGAILWYVDHRQKGEKTIYKIGIKEALLIGISQALALIPGVSRSGVTMTAGLILGLTRVEAARFSFLMSTPIILGAAILKAKDFFAEPITPQMISGIIVAAVLGFLSIKYLIKYVQFRDYKIFTYYRFLFAIVVVGIYFIR